MFQSVDYGRRGGPARSRNVDIMTRKNRRFDELRAFVVPKAKAFVVPKAKLVQKSVWNRHFVLNSTKIVGLVLFYYSFSITLTFYNQRFIHIFQFPLSITLVHLVTKFVIAACIRNLLKWLSGKPRVTLGWWPYIKKLSPPGIASSIDIGLSNWSFEYITVSLYTMTKSTAIIFIMAFSILFKLEKPRCSLVAVVLCIALGLFMFTYESTQFNLLGFLLVLGASFTTGIRWTLSQLIMQKSELGLTNPLDMMYHIQPWMILALLPLAAGFEGLRVATSVHTFHFHDVHLLMEHIAILMAGALLAFMLELSEFLLVRLTNSLTLSISGIIKEIATLLLATFINGDHMNALNAMGLVVCLIGITIHIVLRAVYAEETTTAKVNREDVMQLLSTHTEDDDEDEVVEWPEHGTHRNIHSQQTRR